MPQALFGKRPTEKDPAKGTSPAVHFTLREPGGETPPGYSPGCQPRYLSGLLHAECPIMDLADRMRELPG